VDGGNAVQRDDMIRVLGPIDLLTGAGVVPVGGRNARALLAALVVAAGHAVPTDALLDAVWGDSPPSTGDEMVHTYVSRLRQILGNDVIVRADHMYRLAVTRDQIDALRFEDLMVAATEARDEPSRCRVLCHQALDLWRGEPFGDLFDEEAFRLEAMRLDELRVSTMELALEAELALGRNELVVAELASAVEEHPYRERLWHLLIEALVRSDRRVEALVACGRLRGVLAEAGLEAGTVVCDLEARIRQSSGVGLGDRSSPALG
jgi:DNA-binding SARP family transcriptional activator